LPQGGQVDLVARNDPQASDLVLRELRSQIQDDVNAFVLDEQRFTRARLGVDRECQRIGPTPHVPDPSQAACSAAESGGGSAG
jgi:hypothetical protein